MIVERSCKKVGSTKGQSIVESSPLLKCRLRGINKKILEIKEALKFQDFTKFGTIVEAEAINMHAIMMTSNPPLFYWSPETFKLMLAVSEWRDNGLECYFTIDAGPNVHVLCKGKDEKKVLGSLNRLDYILNVIVNKPSKGAELIFD